DPAVGEGVVHVARPVRVVRTLLLDRPNHRIPGEDLTQREVRVEAGQPGAMAHRRPNRDLVLSLPAELGPVVVDRGVEGDASFLDQDVHPDGQAAFPSREDHRAGVVLPRPARPRVRHSAPQVHNGGTVDVDGARRAQVVAAVEVLDERLQHGLEALGHRPLDDSAVAQLDTARTRALMRMHTSTSSQPFTEPWSRAVTSCLWSTTNITKVGSRITIVPAHSRGMSVA